MFTAKSNDNIFFFLFFLNVWLRILNSNPLSFFQSSSLISNATATALLSLGAIDYCLHVLKSLLEFWKSQQGEEEPVATSQLLRPHTASSPPDMSPFFLRQYVKVSPTTKKSHSLKYEKLTSAQELSMSTHCVASLIRDMLPMCLKPIPSY